MQPLWVNSNYRMDTPQCSGTWWSSELIIWLTNVKALSKSTKQGMVFFSFSSIVHDKKRAQGMGMFLSAGLVQLWKNLLVWPLWTRYANYAMAFRWACFTLIAKKDSWLQSCRSTCFLSAHLVRNMPWHTYKNSLILRMIPHDKDLEK